MFLHYLWFHYRKPLNEQTSITSFLASLSGKKSKNKIRHSSSPNKRLVPIREVPYEPQAQSPLTRLLSAELRIQICNHMLAAPSNLLHVLHYLPHHGELQRLGHPRCQRNDDPHPVWQHRCFGTWTENGILYHRRDSQANGDLLSLLLTCRLM